MKWLCLLKHKLKTVCGPRGQSNWRRCLRCKHFEEKR